uniref:Sugar phosphate transporter domain-containing protein n=1 Tax=Heterosigma akashiwo TaxID=2829 RepID=A0A6S9M622_HETAK|mmetsp:Transcript_50567/g.86994  ORF Transcript_50567/g.86994 Transcript_50567/m.86994 type:complete len:399 (-) Transcript_50567:270-1466(-)
MRGKMASRLTYKYLLVVSLCILFASCMGFQTSRNSFYKVNNDKKLGATLHSSLAMSGSIRSHQTFELQKKISSWKKLKAAAATSAEGDKSSWERRLKIGGTFGVMYGVNVAYNVYNKKVLNVFPYPIFVGTLQMFLGIAYWGPLWLFGARATPKLSIQNLVTLLPVSLAYIMSHICTTIALSAGAMSFAHIVKAAEPMFTAGVSAAMGQFFPWQVYATLVPVVGGVGLACLKELSFSWWAFLNAALANLGGALRSALGKQLMGQAVGENMDAKNLNAVLLLMMSVMLCPFILATEGKLLAPGWRSALAAGYPQAKLLSELLISGILFCLYQEVSFLALDNVHPITHSLGQTFKRAVLIVASVVFFGTKLTPLGALGSAVALAGVFLYSMAKDYYGGRK